VNWKRAFYITAAIGAPFIALLAFGMTRDPRSIPSPLPGRTAPEFSRQVFAPGADAQLRLKVGDTVRLADHRGQVVVLNFWASWCLECQREHLDLSQTSQKYASRGDVKFYGVLYNDKEVNGLRWIEDMGGQAYPALSDPGARLAIDYGLYGVPETFVIDQRGVVARKFIGGVYSDSLSKLLDSLLVAKAPVSGSGPADSALRRSVPDGKTEVKP
jgi:cytochrome c biogenesis protein CcmG/thiol:disulfide interchange protein DsbE